MLNRKVSTNIAQTQSGSIAAQNEKYVLGNKSGFPSEHGWEAFRYALAAYDPSYLVWNEHFLGAAVSSAITTTVSSGASFAISSAVNGIARATTGATDDNFVNVALSPNFNLPASSASNGFIEFEAKVRTTALTTRGIEVGLNDAVTETGGLAFSNHAVGSVTAVASKGYIFSYNTDDSITTWHANWINNGTAYAANLGVTVAANTWYTLRLRADNDGRLAFFINGTKVYESSSFVETTASVLTPWVSLKALAGASAIMDVDYIRTLSSAA